MRISDADFWLFCACAHTHSHTQAFMCYPIHTLLQFPKLRLHEFKRCIKINIHLWDNEWWLYEKSFARPVIITKNNHNWNKQVTYTSMSVYFRNILKYLAFYFKQICFFLSALIMLISTANVRISRLQLLQIESHDSWLLWLFCHPLTVRL